MNPAIEFDGRLVPRVGFGTMRLTGLGVAGPPPDLAEARRVLRRAIELGVRVFDTAWYYGPDVPNQLLAEAVRESHQDVVVATKLGWNFGSRGVASAHTREQLRAAMQRDLRLLAGVPIAITHLRWTSDPAVSEPFRRALAAMVEMRDEGSCRHVGLSNVGRAQLEYALSQTPIGSVSNSFSVADQGDAEIVELTASEGIAYLPWLPLRAGNPRPDGRALSLGREPRLLRHQRRDHRRPASRPWTDPGLKPETWHRDPRPAAIPRRLTMNASSYGRYGQWTHPGRVDYAFSRWTLPPGLGRAPDRITSSWRLDAYRAPALCR